MSTPLPQLTQAQVSGRDEEGWILSVLAKRTYLFGADQHCALANEQKSLVLEPQHAPGKMGVLLADVDTWPYKRRTDVVVVGKAYNHRGLPSFAAGVRIGAAEKTLDVLGDRRCTVDAAGRTLFSTPSVVDNVPLSYEFSYGGRDRATEARQGNFVDELRPFFSASEVPSDLLDDASPFCYPRSPWGRGYLVEATEALEELALAEPRISRGSAPNAGEHGGGHGRWVVQAAAACLPGLAGLRELSASGVAGRRARAPAHDQPPRPSRGAAWARRPGYSGERRPAQSGRRERGVVGPAAALSGGRRMGGVGEPAPRARERSVPPAGGEAADVGGWAKRQDAGNPARTLAIQCAEARSLRLSGGYGTGTGDRTVAMRPGVYSLDLWILEQRCWKRRSVTIVEGATLSVRCEELESALECIPGDAPLIYRRGARPSAPASPK